MLSLPPPQDDRSRLIAEARRRGLSFNAIGDRIGLTRQRVQQIYQRHERLFGQRPAVKYSFQGDPAQPQRHLSTCQVCGRGVEEVHDRVRGGWRRVGFCSYACRGLADRLLSDEEIEIVIAARKNGVTWEGASSVVGQSANVVRTSVWRFLHENGRLTKDEAESIYRPASSPYSRRKNASYAWLERLTGYSPR